MKRKKRPSWMNILWMDCLVRGMHLETPLPLLLNTQPVPNELKHMDRFYYHFMLFTLRSYHINAL